MKKVITVCYGQVQEWPSRKAAIKEFTQGALECDGAEAQRYMTVVEHLMRGYMIATDNYFERPMDYENLLKQIEGVK